VEIESDIGGKKRRNRKKKD